MLDLLIAADQAAHTPERRELLEGLLEGQDRQVERAMEADTDHGELLGDDFFWCFMGLAMAQGDSAFWRTMGNWGYTLRSEVRHPDEDSNASLELGTWGAAFLPPERLEWLTKKGLLEPLKPSHHIKKGGRISPAEYGMLVGPPDQFDYWAPQWKTHYENEAAQKKNQRTPAKGFHVPTMLNLLLGYQSWQESENPFLPFPTNGLAPGELQRRIDRVSEVVISAHYPNANRTERLVPFLKNPPFTHDTSDAHTTGLVRWMVAQEAHPWTHQEVEYLHHKKEWEWLQAAIENGAPLNVDGKYTLAHALAKSIMAFDEKKDWRVGPEKSVRAFLKRARKEDPSVENAFFFPEEQEPVLFQCLKKREFKNIALLFYMGANGQTLSNGGATIGASLLHELRNPQGPKDGWLVAWRGWRKSMEGENRKDVLAQVVQEEQSWNSNALPLDIALLKKHRWEPLTTLIKNGFPLSGPGAHGASFGHQLLLQIGEKPNLPQMAETWDAYRSKAGQGSTGGPSMGVTQKDIYALAEDWDSHVSFWVRAAAFDEMLPEAAPKPKNKPRF